MLGPAVSNSVRTPDLMAEAGLLYHADWMHDDQPVPLRVRGAGRLVSVPYSTELNDVCVFLGHVEADDFVAMAKAQFDVLWREAGESGSGRVMCLAIHPYLMGMPHRARYLDEIFEHVLSHEDVWPATAGEIARWFIDHHYDEFTAHAAGFADGGGRAR